MTKEQSSTNEGVGTKTSSGFSALWIVFHGFVLFAFWFILSGKADLFHLLLGAGCSLIVAYWTGPLMMVARADGKPLHGMALPWGRMVAYLPWLLWQIVLSSIAVARVVLSPRMPIRPRLVRFKVQLPGDVAYLTLGNSITLTPGTVTVDRHGDELLIHALTEQSVDGLLSGDMQKRVAGVFKSAIELEEHSSRPGPPVEQGGE